MRSVISPHAFPALPCLMVIALAACFGAGAPWGWSHGLLFAVAGLLMLLRPPEGWSARGALWLAAAWIVPAVSSLWLPASLVAQSWRASLANVGIDLAHTISPQPEETRVMLMAMSAAGIVVVWALGHAADGNTRMRTAMLFVWGVVWFTVADWVTGVPTPDDGPRFDFGFFPNRNHSACLLAMAAVVALGLTVQQLRRKRPVQACVSAAALLFLGGSLIARSPSRAGIALVLVGGLLWWAMLGTRYLRGQAGRTVWLMLLAAVLSFAVVDSVVKERLGGTLQTALAGGDAAAPVVLGNDARAGIASDTLSMIAAAPWTGHGAGQFRFVFPQYRDASSDTADRDALHPESSWLWLAAETGLPAALLIFASLLWVSARAWRDLRRPDSRAKALRAACLAAALLPAIHGWIDVPLHRIGILWSSAVLMALALSGERPQVRRITRISWRLAGAAVALFALWLLRGEADLAPRLPSERLEAVMHQAESVWWQDRKQQLAAAGQGIALPDPPNGEDPLEQQIALLQQAMVPLPMHAAGHGLLGLLALHFDDRDALAHQAFAAHRALDPRWITLPLDQAEAWSAIDEAATADLWQDALRRAREHDARWPVAVLPTVEARIRETAERSETLRQRADALLGEAQGP
jgi:O-antigen ligase